MVRPNSVYAVRAVVLSLLLGIASLLQAQNISEQYLFAAANQERSARGLEPLQYEQHLLFAASKHAFEMARRREISHQFPGETGLAERAGEAGAHFSLVTENVAEASNAALIHDLWMNSAGHRANLLDPQVNAVGIAVVVSRGQLYAVEDFARTVAQSSLVEQESTVVEMLSRPGLRVSAGSEVSRQTCALASGFAGTHRPWFVMRYTTADLRVLPDELTTRLQTGKYHQAEVGACVAEKQGPFSAYSLAVMLYP